MFRITGKEGGGLTSILASHPLTEDRLARMTKKTAPPAARRCSRMRSGRR